MQNVYIANGVGPTEMEVVISDATIAQYAQTAKHCMGLRIMRLQRSPLSRIE